MPDTTLSLVKSHASQQRTGRVTLLERKTALDALAEIAAQARSGEGRLLLLEGEADVGKSTLLEQFTHDLPDSRLLSGACDGMFTPRPLGPLFDIAQQVHGRLHSLCRADASREELFDALLTGCSSLGTIAEQPNCSMRWAAPTTRRSRCSMRLTSWRCDERSTSATRSGPSRRRGSFARRCARLAFGPFRPGSEPRRARIHSA